jgi:predicted ATPase
MKLLCKDATERYKSCAGLLYDLERCKQLLQIYNNGVFDIEYFNIAEDDVLERFIVPTKLYGRDNEIELLQNTFRSVSTQGTSRMVLVSGYSGVGKSSLVREVQRSAQIRNGYFISGKFDQLERNIAYTAFSDALQGLVKQVLGESDQLVETWKQKILDALGTNANVLIELIPELVKLVGKQPPVIPIGPQEAKNRFDSTMQKFLNLFLTEETQLVIFLDDLQWADRGSLDLIQLLLENKYLLFIGAYRDNEVGAKHPTMQMIENIRNSAVPVLDIVLKPLSYETVHEWIVDTLQEQENAQAEQTDDDKRTFSELVYQKTEGNPFFVKMFLQTLNDEGLLIREGKSWRWNISSIKKQSVTDNVVNLMTHRLEQFSGATREAIKWASCLGNNFE